MNWKGLELYGTVHSDPEPLQSRTMIESGENESFFQALRLLIWVNNKQFKNV